MNWYNNAEMSIKSLVTFCVLIGTLCWTSEGKAQFEERWLYAGSLAAQYSSAGARPEIGGFHDLRWPAPYPHSENYNFKGLWFLTKNFTDENGKTWPVRNVHVGPRFRGTGEFFPQSQRTISRFEPPLVYVDGFRSFLQPVFNDEVDPTLEPARVIHNEINTLVGITLEQRIMQFSQRYHDNYHVIEYTFTNTGEVNGEISLPEQTLEGVYMWIPVAYAINSQAHGVVGGGTAWGRNAMVDAVGDGMEDYEVDFRAQYAWHGFEPDFNRWDNIGAPTLDASSTKIAEDDTLGRLTAAHFVGRVVLHADKSADDSADDPAQPSVMSYMNRNHQVLTSGQDAYNLPQMQDEYRIISEMGRNYPHHADLIAPPEPGESFVEQMARQRESPSFGEGAGHGFMEGYGPYTLEPGESVRIVVAEGVDGLTRKKASRVIGRAYKEAYLAGNGDKPIDFDADGDGEIEPDESMSKNEWVMTSRDSLFQTFNRALANYNSDWNIPEPPKPPREFRVSSRPDRIQLEWEPYADANPQGWEIWRASERIGNTPYELVAELGPERRSFEDTDVTRGIGYFYYILAVGEENNDNTGLTPTGVRLKSNRNYTQTFDPAILKRPPGDELSDARIVPNPYNIGSSSQVRWPDQQDKIGFLNIPGNSTIRIFTETGELVETIEHTDGSGDAYWDLTTSANQVIVSGVYLASIQNNDTGETITRNIIIIR